MDRSNDPAYQGGVRKNDISRPFKVSLICCLLFLHAPLQTLPDTLHQYSSKMVATIPMALPWWQQHWFYIIVALLAFIMIILIRKYELSRIVMRNQIKISQLQTSQLQKIDTIKSQFLANISHELRTPITLIRGPLIQMLDEHPDLQKRKYLAVMLNNTNRLLRLIDQLLDLSRLDQGDYPLQVKTGSLLPFLKKIVKRFDTLANQQNITLTISEELFEEDLPLLKNCYYDPDVIEKIINNLLINAFKFTPKKGRITLRVGVTMNDDKVGKEIEIGIADTGIGIPEDKIPYIFDRFYQVDATSKKRQQGAGIGLAYVKELAKVHRMKIAVKSQVNQGTEIMLRLCPGSEHYDLHQIYVPPPGQQVVSDSTPMVGQEDPLSTASAKKHHPKDPVILVIEDHEDVGRYIMESLSINYQAILALNGQEGIRLAQSLIPDLIISDVMMPGINGIELCQTVKNDERTSHIPVILLTARAGDKDRLLGLQTGSDDYLTKPFNPNELKIRVKNLIETRRKMREKFSSNTIIRPAEISVTSRDQAFLENLMKIVENNLTNEQFSIDDLAREANMSQSQLHRKLKAVVNQTAHHFIRSVRMQRARELLHQNAGNISDVAYMVGYNDPGYFSRIFKSYFGAVPSEIRHHKE